MARVFAQAQDCHPEIALAAVTSDLGTLPKIGAPATRALAGAGYTSLRQLAGVPRSELEKLHGMGPKALGILQAALAEHGLSLG
jgi:Helix-hairpin-helix domain